jgi:hypothetical protein
MFLSENSFNLRLIIPNTEIIIPRRSAPRCDLLVQVVFRASDSRRKFRSLWLLVLSTSGCSTNTSKQFNFRPFFCNRIIFASESEVIGD